MKEKGICIIHWCNSWRSIQLHFHHGGAEFEEGEIEQLIGGGEGSLPKLNPPVGGRKTIMSAVLG